MESLTPSDQARSAGLAIYAEGDTPVMRGPRHAEVMARMLLTNKVAVMALLNPINATPKRWRWLGGGYHPGPLKCLGSEPQEEKK